MSADDHAADPIRTILVPTDGSDAAGTALERALQFAEPDDATVHVLSVVDTTTNPMRFGVAEVAELDRATEELVDEIVDAYGDRDVEIRGAIRRGRPASTILAYAEENEIDLLVVGRTGRDGVADALLGSTTDRLVRQASIPVIVVPASGTVGNENREIHSRD
ncbi:universal stress protein [Natronococcus pandeyae]|uniref:Universal stress protein n=1 Tax=Natronococcus pandeyae TaxID=2055836 RepID=A0A8J8PZA5_9EURY|nr:universal stress protein [Natronococcus pandeyae]TYL36541.1 universal stress protein [Natronococcus pandeyae]